MSDRPRSFPDRPSLRYLKIEARRRQAAGEFPTLHEAQLAIAREYGLPSWTALKRFVAERPNPDGPAVGHLRWVRVGLGWSINQQLGGAGHAGGVAGTSASLVTRLGSGRVYVALANRRIPVEPVNGRVVRATAGRMSHTRTIRRGTTRSRVARPALLPDLTVTGR